MRSEKFNEDNYKAAPNAPETQIFQILIIIRDNN